jgi:organic hydroperoxide reductase OsmC/OhrA
MNLEHHYAIALEWTGNRGTGTSDYKSYGRDHVLSTEGKHDIAGSSDTAFRGDADRWNPEEMLLSALSQCHMLSYLYVATTQDIVVTAYTDAAVGTIAMTADGGGHFSSVTLRPVVTVASQEMVERALAAHHEANVKCFIAASVNFPVLHEPTIVVAA